MKLADWVWKVPAFLLATTAVAAGVIRFMGVTTETMPERFDDHLTAEESWHGMDAEQDSLGFGHLQHLEVRQDKMENVVYIEQCMENPYTMLARQKLLPTCDSLGIHRVARDTPPGE